MPFAGGFSLAYRYEQRTQLLFTAYREDQNIVHVEGRPEKPHCYRRKLLPGI